MKLKLKWKGIDRFTQHQRKRIENDLNQKGESALPVFTMPREMAEKIASLNKLSLDYATLYSGEKSVEFYIFRVDQQILLRNMLKERRQWGYARNLIIASLFVFVLGLIIQVFLDVR